MTLETRLSSCQGRGVRHPTSKDARLELVRERFLIQKNPWILEFVIEPVLDSSDTMDSIVQVAVPGQHNHRGVGSPNLQRLGRVEIWRNVVLVGDIFMGVGGELVFNV